MNLSFKTYFWCVLILGLSPQQDLFSGDGSDDSSSSPSSVGATRGSSPQMPMRSLQSGSDADDSSDESSLTPKGRRFRAAAEPELTHLLGSKEQLKVLTGAIDKFINECIFRLDQVEINREKDKILIPITAYTGLPRHDHLLGLIKQTNCKGKTFKTNGLSFKIRLNAILLIMLSSFNNNFIAVITQLSQDFKQTYGQSDLASPEISFQKLFKITKSKLEQIITTFAEQNCGPLDRPKAIILNPEEIKLLISHLNNLFLLLQHLKAQNKLNLLLKFNFQLKVLWIEFCAFNVLIKQFNRECPTPIEKLLAKLQIDGHKEPLAYFQAIMNHLEQALAPSGF